MSRYYVGPFGRILPAADVPSSEQQPQRPATLPARGNLPYQLPPPRTSTNLQFGTDPFLGQHHSTENAEPGTSLPPADVGSQRRRTEQLPSVRQLLSPVPDSNPPSSYPTQVFDILSSSNERHESSYPFLHKSSLPSHVSPVKDHSDSPPPPQTGSLPPLSEVTMQSLGDIKRHAVTQSDPTALSFYQPSPLHGVAFHEKALSADLSSPKSTNRPTVPSVRPHVVDERYIEGEGLCYVYADGSHCPKSINGVPVNASWGVTKAGKPRKRLAQACLTCREKKIKCQPNLPKCDQCQKFGRKCRFESAPRRRRAPLTGSHSGSSGKYDMTEGLSSGGNRASESSPSLYNAVPASDSVISLAGTSGHSPMSDGSILTPSAAENPYEATPDAHRTYQFRTQPPAPLLPRVDKTPATAHPPEPVGSNRLEYSDILGELPDVDPGDPLAASWNSDPYESDAELATHLVECYFSYVNNNLYPVFPHAQFILWLRSCHTKTAEDKMLLYSMMALGSVFSERSDKARALRRYSRIARFAISHSQHHLSLQLVQSHLIMTLWYYATGSIVRSWDSIGAAGRAVCGLRYNMESGGVVVYQNQACDYGLHPQALIECRRRTFWMAFVLDRLAISYSASSPAISSESALLRLPCREEAYEAQQYATAPYFQSFLNQTPISAEDCSALSSMAFLIEIMALWGNVSLQVFRLLHVPGEKFARVAEDVHTNIFRQTSDWITGLPEHLAFTVFNLERSIRANKADTFISIYMFYHATLMKMYRHARHQSLRAEVLTHYIHHARYHAMEILRIVLAFDQYARDIDSSRFSADPSSPKTSLLNPFLGYVILSAVDVLSAAGPVAELPECLSMIREALESVKELGIYWASTSHLVSALQARINAMADCVNDRARFEKKMGFALDGPLLETKVHTDALAWPQSTLSDDLFAATAMPREVLLNAMRIDDIGFSVDNILWIRDP